MDPHPQFKKWLQDDAAEAATLITIVADRFGETDPENPLEFLSWDPETLHMEVRDEFDVVMSDINFNKLMAAIELITTDHFYTSLSDFVRMCNILTNGTWDVEAWDPADAGEVAWGLTEGMLIWPPTSENPFIPEIISYIELAVRDEGIITPPDVLRLGAIDENAWNKIQHAFSDDPVMFQAIYQVEKMKTDEINNFVKWRLNNLLQQLNSLPLKNGETKDAVRGMFKALQIAEQVGASPA